MLSALLYLQYHSIRNRTVMRFKRLKQPKYLIGGIVGGLYFYVYFFRYFFGGRAGRQSFLAAATPETLDLYVSLGALALLVIVLLAWLIPHQRAALAFTEAEVAFLFPAPISRRGLIHFKLLRSQTAILFTTLLLTLVTNRFGPNGWVRAAGWWLVLSTLNLHFLGCSFARTMLVDRGFTNWQRRLWILALLAAAVGVVAVWGARTLPALDLSQFRDFDSPSEPVEKAQVYLQKLLTSGPAPWLLYPFRLVVRPFLAPDGYAFLKALGPALLVMLLHYGWVIRSDVAFEEASVEASKKTADKLAAVRAGNWQATRKQPKGKRAPFALRPVGPQALALLWKNLISAGQAITLRLWITLVVIGVATCVGLGQSEGGSGLFAIAGTVVGMLLVWSVLIGPQFLRQDFRQDLPLVDVLKTYPMRGWQIVLGEVLAPAVVLTCVQWFLVIVGAVLLWQSPQATLGWPGKLAIALGAALLVPVLNLITLQIPNAAVLLFPAWFQSVKGGAQGIEVTGQRLIYMLGQSLVLALALIPAVLVAMVVFFLTKMMLSLAVAILLASVVAATVLAAEAALGVMLLGRLFERFDVAAEPAT